MNQFCKIIIYYWLPLIFYCLFIFIQSAFPSPVSGFGFRIPHLDKILHFSGYALLGALFFRAVRNSWCQADSRIIIFISITFSTLYGLTDEFHQSFVVYRTSDIMDFWADMCGSVFGVSGYYFITSIITAYFREKIPD